MAKAVQPVGTIGHAIKAMRTGRGRACTQRVAAKEMTELSGIEVSQPNVQRWEAGDVEPGAEFYAAIFPWLGVDEATAAWLVYRTRLVFGGVELDASTAWKLPSTQLSNN